MVRSSCPAAACAAALLVGLVSFVASAQPPPRAQQPQPSIAPLPRVLRIEYVGTERCPSVAFFRERVVLKRPSHVDPFTQDASARLVVTLGGDTSGYRGGWEAFDAAGVSVRRHDLGPVANCHDLVDGLAFGFVLRFDDPAMAPTSVVPAPSGAPVPVPGPAVVAPPVDAPKLPPPAASRVFVGLSGVLGLATTPAPAGGGMFALGWRASWWSVSGELRAMLALNAPVDGGYHVTLHRVTGALLPCLHMSRLFACAALELGELGGTSTADVPASDSVFIATLGGRAGVELPIGAHLAFRGAVDGFGTVKPAVVRIGGEPRWETPGGGVLIGAGLLALF